MGVAHSIVLSPNVPAKEKGRPKATLIWFGCDVRYSRLPKNCSRNMNMLMKLM